MHRAQSLALCLSLLLVPSAGARAQGGPIDPHALRAWRQGWWSLPWRAYYSLVTLGALGFVAFLAEWNLLGFRY